MDTDQLASYLPRPPSSPLKRAVLAVRPFCSQDNYWQVYFDTNRTIRESFGEAGFPAPELRYHVSGKE